MMWSSSKGTRCLLRLAVLTVANIAVLVQVLDHQNRQAASLAAAAQRQQRQQQEQQQQQLYNVVERKINDNNHHPVPAAQQIVLLRQHEQQSFIDNKAPTTAAAAAAATEEDAEEGVLQQVFVATDNQTVQPPISSSSLSLSSTRITKKTERKRTATSPLQISSSFEVAKQESFGFFTDISNKQWQLKKQRVQREPLFFEHEQHSFQGDQAVSWWLFHNVDPTFTCPFEVRIGGRGDGPKWVCDPHRLKRMRKQQQDLTTSATGHTTNHTTTTTTTTNSSSHTTTTTEENNNNCLIYSFGSNGNYLFEDAMVHFLRDEDEEEKEQQQDDCEIHVFDPDPQYARPGDAQNNNIHYHAFGLKSSYDDDSDPSGRMINNNNNDLSSGLWGLGEEDDFTLFGLPPPNEQQPPSLLFEFKTMQEIVQELGHERRRIDILKIDCEGCEWTTYQDWLEETFDIRQVLIETHSLPAERRQFFQDLHDRGFVPFHKEANTHPLAGVGVTFEWGFVRLHTSFFQ